ARCPTSPLFPYTTLFRSIDSSVSFAIRPLSALALGRTNVFVPDSLMGLQSKYYTPDRKGYVQLMPASIMLQINSAYPYGWNDGRSEEHTSELQSRENLVC